MIPGIRNGLQSKMPEVQPTVPTSGFMHDGATRANRVDLGYATESGLQASKPKYLNDTIDYSTARGVIMCKNDLRVRVLRGAPPEQLDRPPAGYGRHQNQTISYTAEHPNDLPIMPLASSQHASLINRLGQPP